jgi:tetratricopeptide (TPR) repeat protein
VVTSDHGEGLGDHRESLHGFFIYETTLSVPLFFRGPGVSPGLKLPALVRTVDLLPTLLDLMGVARPQGAPLSGESLAAALDGGDPPREPIAYAESLVPLLHFGWSDLRSVRRGNWKYIQAPRPELYDLATDPGEKVNRVETESGRVRGMQAALGRYLDDEKAAGGSRGSAGSVPPELLAKLGALGYVGAGAPIDSGTPGADPKDKIDEFRVANDLIREGIVRFHDRDFEGSVSRYQELLRRGIESFEVHFYLARGLMGLKRFQEAETHFAEATARLPAHVGAWEGLAGSRSARGDLAGALAAVKGGQRALPQEAGLHQREGALLIRMGRAREARRVYETAVALAPRDALLRARLGELLRDLGEVEEAIRRLSEAVELDPEPASYWNSMGMTLGGNGRLPEAEAAFREAWKRNDKSARYAFNLGLVLLRQGRGKEARPFFEAALHLEPGFAEAKSRLQEAGAR